MIHAFARMLRDPLKVPGLAALVLLLAALVQRLDAAAPGFFGTARAPHSDALGNWLYGALEFFFFKDFTNELLFRPQVGIFFSSILAISGDIAVVPALFTGALVAVFLLHAAVEGPRARLIACGLLAHFVVNYDPVVAAAAVDSLNTDFMAMVFTLAGLLLVPAALRGFAVAPGAGGRGDAGARALLYTGFLMVGLAATLRGPMLIAGPVLVLLAAADAWRRGVRTATIALDSLAAALLVVLPVVADTMLIAGAGVSGSGMPTLYSVVADPAHRLSAETHFQYIDRHPTNAEVVRAYLAFVFSPEGAGVLLRHWQERLAGDLAWVTAGPVGAVLTGLYAVVVLLPRRAAHSRPVPGLLRGARLAVLGLLALGLAMPERLPDGLITAALLTVVAVAGLGSGHVYGPAFAATSAGGTLFLALTGTTGYARIIVTFQYALLGALLALALEGPEPPGGRWRHRARGLAAAVPVAFVAVLYSANFILDPPLRQTYHSQVLGRSAAIKLSGDRQLDRCVYFTGSRDILFTRYDEVPVSSVVVYSRFENPTGLTGEPGRISGARLYNALFHQPGRFVTDDGDAPGSPSGPPPQTTPRSSTPRPSTGIAR
jgi:hypothetical protein